MDRIMDIGECKLLLRPKMVKGMKDDIIDGMKDS